jgi:hypothetical protein
MTRQLVAIILAAFLTAQLSIDFPTAEARQQCSAAMPSNPQGRWWSYRLIDGRKCWYEGRPGLSKSLLEWPREASAQTPPDEKVTNIISEKPRNPLESQAWAPLSQPAGLEDLASFEARWRTRANVETRAMPDAVTSLAGLKPAMHDIDDGPPLKKGDRLQSPYFDSRQSKVIHTLVIVPDPPHPAAGPN